MTTAQDQWQLFGIDLTRLPLAWMQGWREVAGWPWVARFVPRIPVEAHDADGHVAVRNGATTATLTGARPAVAALELPDEGVLLRRLRLPALPDRELRSALALEVAAVSPFPPEQTVWGWSVESDDAGAVGGSAVTLAIAARDYVEGRLAAASQLKKDMPVEVWARSGDAVVVMQGFDEPVRRRLERRRLALLVGQLMLAGILLLALAAIPALQAMQRVTDAEQRFAQLRTAVADDLDLRDALVQQRRKADAVRAHFGEPVDLLGLLGQLTRLVPDDAYVTAFRWDREGSASIRGLAADAAALIDRIGAEPGLTLARSPAAISRDRATQLETFAIDFHSAAVAGQ
jgi:general secretion pathway protein L